MNEEKKRLNKKEADAMIGRLSSDMDVLESLYLNEMADRRVHVSLNQPEEYIRADSNSNNFADAIDHLGVVINCLKRLYW
ncbi:MAG: hypothetical protein LIP12_10070 [Clostridiales bacterium]|nr:hypothetical protein [Clostridiales bacterium]